MRKIYYFISAIVLFASVSIILSVKNERKEYEKFILEKAQTISIPVAKEEGLKAVDQPDMAAFQEYLMTVDPQLGFVPKKRLLDAYYQTIAMEKNIRLDYAPPVEWEGTAANMGGRTRALMFDPNSSSSVKVWAGGVTGGLWYNDDISAQSNQWVPVNDFWANLAVSCMTFDPNNTNIFYVGTGEAQTARIIYRESSGVGAGIYKSMDGGQSWDLMESTSEFQYITDIAVRNESGTSVIYAAVASGVYHGEDHDSQPSDGLYRSVDGGETWQQVLPFYSESAEEPYTPADIEIAYNGRIYVGTMENLNGLGGATILFSDSGLEGSWTVYNYYNNLISNENYYNIPARTIIASSPSDPEIVYAAFAAGYVNGFTYYRGMYIAKSTDSGLNWTQTLSPPTDEWATLAWHAFVLKVDPADPDAIFTGGLDLWKSEDAGNTFERVSDWSLMYWGGGDQYVHADQHTIQYLPGDAETAIFSSDGGVFLSQTAGLFEPVFQEKNNGYNTLQFYSCAMNPTAGANKYIGGLQDNGTLYYNDNSLDINDMIDGGDGAYCFWDQDEPMVFITSVYYNSYSTWYNGTPYESFGGNSGTFISPADYDYKLNILYSNAVSFFGSGANRLLRASGIPFSPVENMINLGTNSTVPFSHVKYSPYSPAGTSTLFVGTEAGKLYKVVNAQATPLSTDIGSPDFPNANISCVAIGEDEDQLLVTFSNYGVSSVWLSWDGGETWKEKESNLPDMPVRWAIFHPENEGQALLATETGVWATNTLLEDATEWSPATSGMANVRVDMLQLREADNTVLAASHGRGLFTCTYELDVYTGLEDPSADDLDCSLYPNPANNQVNLVMKLKQSGNVEVLISDVNGKIIRNENFSAGEAVFNHSLDISELKRGLYFLQIKAGRQSFTKKLLVT